MIRLITPHYLSRHPELSADALRSLPGATEDASGIRVDDEHYQRHLSTLPKPQPKPKPPKALQLQHGPGTELRLVFESLGIKPTACAGKCAARESQMNLWGVDGCREHRETIIGWMREAYGTLTVGEKLKVCASSKSWPTLWKISLTDPFGSMLDLAISNASGSPCVVCGTMTKEICHFNDQFVCGAPLCNNCEAGPGDSRISHTHRRKASVASALTAPEAARPS